MIRLVSVAAACLTSAVLLTATASPARAAAAADYYRATPVNASARDTVMARDTLWRCQDGTCSATRANSRDAVVCQAAAQRLGALSAFTAGGKELTAEDLAKCNARAN